MLKFEVNGQSLVRCDSSKVVGDSRNYLKAGFEFSDDWEGAEPKLAGFWRLDRSDPPIQQELDEGGECLVPWEVLRGSGIMGVSVAAGDLITANAVTVSINKAGKPGVLTPTESTPGVLGELMEKLNENTEAIEALKADVATDEEVDEVLSEIFG